MLLKDMLGKQLWYSIHVSGNDRHILLFYKKCHFCHLLPFAKEKAENGLLTVCTAEWEKWLLISEIKIMHYRPHISLNPDLKCIFDFQTHSTRQII